MQDILHSKIFFRAIHLTFYNLKKHIGAKAVIFQNLNLKNKLLRDKVKTKKHFFQILSRFRQGECKILIIFNNVTHIGATAMISYCQRNLKSFKTCIYKKKMRHTGQSKNLEIIDSFSVTI